MKKAHRRQLFVLCDPEISQAAWVRANSIEEAAPILYRETSIPVVVEHPYGWVEFMPDPRRHRKQEDRPRQRWEFRTNVGGPADLRGMPDYIQDLQRRIPRKPGEVRITDERPRSSPCDCRIIPAGSVISLSHHSSVPNYRPEWACQARVGVGRAIVGIDEINERPVEEGELALVTFEPEAELPRVDDRLRIMVKGDNHDHFVFVKVLELAVTVEVLEIQGCGAWP